MLPTNVSSYAATGVLSGNPGVDADGTYTFELTAANGIGSNATQAFTLTVSPFVVSGSTLTIYGTTNAATPRVVPAANNSFTVTMDSYTATYGFGAIQNIQFLGDGGSDTTNLFCRPTAR